MASVFKSLWNFAAGDWQEGQVYCGFSLVTSFHIQLHSSRSKGPSSWQPPSLLASAGMPVAERRMCCVPVPSCSLQHRHGCWSCSSGEAFLGCSFQYPYLPWMGAWAFTWRDVEHFKAVGRSRKKNMQKIGLAEIRSSFANIFKFGNWMKSRYCLSCFLVCLDRFNRNTLQKIFQDKVWKRIFWNLFCLWVM